MVAEIVTSTRAVHDGRIRIVGVGAGARCVSALCKGMADEGVETRHALHLDGRGG
jgi:hypothetical protein